MAESYLKALGLASSIKPKEESAEKPAPQAALTLNVNGLPDVPALLNMLDQALEKFGGIVGAIEAMGAAHEQQKQEADAAIAGLAGKIDAMAALVQRQIDIALAPVVPERDGEGKITSARKILN